MPATEVSIRHAFQSGVPDRDTNGIIKPSHWNDQHALIVAPQRLVGRDDPLTGRAQEIALKSGELEFDGSQVIQLKATGITPGPYTNANVQVDAKGRITAIANGTTTGGATAISQYLLGAADATLPNARLPVDTATLAWDVATANQLKANVITSALNAADLLALIKTVDGSSSGLDADLLDGQSSAFYATASGLSDHIADASAAHAASAISFSATGGLSSADVQAAIAELDTEKQPLDSDLTTIAGLAPSNDDIIQRKAGAWANRTMTQLASDLDSFFLTPAEGNAAYQPLDSDLTAFAALTPSNDDIAQRKAGAWTNRTIAQLLTDLAAPGTTFQPLDSDLTAIAALSTTTYGRAFLALADAAALRTAGGLVIGTNVLAYDADVLFADVSDDLTAGFTSSSVSLGTVSSGTTTLVFATGNVQHYTNNGAHTLAPPSSGHGSIIVDIVNGASAGTITVSGWTKVTGDTLANTNALKYRLFCTVGNGGSHLHKQALQ